MQEVYMFYYQNQKFYLDFHFYMHSTTYIWNVL